MEINEFHWTDGWYFKRNDDGSVRIRKEGDGASSGLHNLAVATIPALEWCSIVSHCTSGGEAENYEKVKALVMPRTGPLHYPAGMGEESRRLHREHLRHPRRPPLDRGDGHA